MEDRHALAQQVEFLKIQLNAANTRELKLKEMYESMIASLTPEDDLRSSEVNRQQLLDECAALNAREAKHLEDLKTYQVTVTHLEHKLDELARLRERSVTELNEKFLQEHNEKLDLAAQVQQLTEALQTVQELPCEAISDVVQLAVNEVSSILRDLTRLKIEASKTVNAWRKQLAEGCAELTHALDELAVKKWLSNSDQVLYKVERNQDELRTLKTALAELHTHVRNYERGEEQLKRVLGNVEQPPVDNTLGLSMSSNRGAALRPRGDLALDSGAKMKSLHSASSPHDHTFSQFSFTSSHIVNKHDLMVTHAVSLECATCHELITTSQFYDHILNCTHEQPAVETRHEQILKLQQELSYTRISAEKMKSARDKAVLDYEQLLTQLKRAKMDLAVAQEKAAAAEAKRKVDWPEGGCRLLEERRDLSRTMQFSNSKLL